jgi:hypothetical protein
MSAYLKTSGKKTPTDPDKISEGMFSNLLTSFQKVCFEF